MPVTCTQFMHISRNLHTTWMYRCITLIAHDTLDGTRHKQTHTHAMGFFSGEDGRKWTDIVRWIRHRKEPRQLPTIQMYYSHSLVFGMQVLCQILIPRSIFVLHLHLILYAMLMPASHIHEYVMTDDDKYFDKYSKYGVEKNLNRRLSTDIRCICREIQMHNPHSGENWRAANVSLFV